MRHIRTLRLPTAAACALVLSACSDDSVSVGDGSCTEVRQTASEMSRALADGGTARVRVNLVSRLGVDRGSGEALTTSGVQLFQRSTCNQLVASTTTRLGSVENDMGGMVADAAVQMGEITAVQVLPADQQTGRRLRAEKLTLPQSIHLEPGTRTEIFVALDSVRGSSEVVPRFVAAGQVALDVGVAMVYEPGRGGAAAMRRGFTLDIPAGSVTQPTVFGIVEHDVGGVASLFDIMPRTALRGTARITFPVDRARIADGLAMGDYGVSMDGSAVASTVSGNTVSMNAGNLGLMSMGSARGYIQTMDGSRYAYPAAPAPDPLAGALVPRRENLVNNTCSQRLSANRSTILSRLSTNAGIRVFDCEDVAPYVHIVLVNMGYSLPSGYSYPRVMLPAEWYTGTTTFLLHTITEEANLVGAFAAVNGFTWSGDEGTDAGQTGTALGTLYINGARMSPAYTGAEAIIGFTSQSGTTSARLFDKPSGGSVSLSPYNWNAVPSTTSIIKNGACSRTSTEGGSNSWSAMGVGNGILVLASSVSGYSTTAYELCSVFEGLNVLGGAIRLDGGPSTSMYWLGTHLNPLTGLSSWKYGSARHIAYAVAGVQ